MDGTNSKVSATEKSNRSFFPRIVYYAKAILLAPVALISAVIRLIQRAALGKEGAEKAEDHSSHQYKNLEESLERRAYSKHMNQALENLLAEKKEAGTHSEYEIKSVKLYDADIGREKYKYGIDVGLENGVKYTLYADQSLNMFNAPTVPDTLKMQVQMLIDSIEKEIGGGVRQLVEDHQNEINDSYDPDMDPGSGSQIAFENAVRAAAEEIVRESVKSEQTTLKENGAETVDSEKIEVPFTNEPEQEEADKERLSYQEKDSKPEYPRVTKTENEITVELDVGDKVVSASRKIGNESFVVHANINEIPKESLDSIMAEFQKQFDEKDPTLSGPESGKFISEISEALRIDLKSENPGNIFCAYGRATFVPEKAAEGNKVNVTRTDKTEHSRSVNLRDDPEDCERKIAGAYAAVSYSEKIPDKGAIPVSYTVFKNGKASIQAVLVEKTRQDSYTIQTEGNGAAKIYTSEPVTASKLGKVAQAFVPESMEARMSKPVAAKVIRSEMQKYDRPDYLVIGKMVANVTREGATDERLTLQSTDKRGSRPQSAIITNGFDKDPKLVDPQVELLITRMNYVQDKSFDVRETKDRDEGKTEEDREVF